ncbi:Uncharacterised protein [Serratia entomophila]|nr:Uncharacterised protein [Serratia entomophila]CAI0783873.1 Uncharacterised protein [Serratia entomophila]CAI0806521.1 Uncharacterised protein [Serratia entomophila]CAI0814463.1 Uncharacterised protein [Serratia entomophila]CAI0815241.1 Uncharacterised protein [Serratia entomophila]
MCQGEKGAEMARNGAFQAAKGTLLVQGRVGAP